MTVQFSLSSGGSYSSPLLCDLQDGFAVVAADGPGDYDVAFEAVAGTAPGRLSPGRVAYITTGAGMRLSWVPHMYITCMSEASAMLQQARPCRRELTRLSR